MNRLNLIALAMLTVAGNVVAMEQAPEVQAPAQQEVQVGFMQKAKNFASAAAGTVAEYKKTSGLVGTSALVVADRKLNKGRVTNFAMDQVVKLLNLVMANKSTSAKATLVAALVYGLYKHIQNRDEGADIIGDRKAGTLWHDDITLAKRHFGKSVTATALLSYLFGDSVVSTVKSGVKTGFDKVTAVEYGKLFNYVVNLIKALPETRAGKAVAAHPRVAKATAGVVAAATTGAVVYKTGLVGKAVTAVKARFAKPAVVAEQAPVVEEQPAVVAEVAPVVAEPAQ